MEPTLTQDCALYYAQHKNLKRRASFFQRFHAADRSEPRKLISNWRTAHVSGGYRFTETTAAERSWSARGQIDTSWKWSVVFRLIRAILRAYWITLV